MKIMKITPAVATQMKIVKITQEVATRMKIVKITPVVATIIIVEEAILVATMKIVKITPAAIIRVEEAAMEDILISIVDLLEVEI